MMNEEKLFLFLERISLALERMADSMAKSHEPLIGMPLASPEEQEKWEKESEAAKAANAEMMKLQAEMIRIAKRQIEEHRKGEEWREDEESKA